MSSGNDELFNAFVTESSESLAGMENDFLAIEEAGEDIDDDLVNKVFRGIHSMKGSAGFLGLTSISKLSHEMENLLNLIRNREIVPTGEIVDAMLKGADLLREMVNNIGTSNNVDVSAQVAAIKRVSESEQTATDAPKLEGETDISTPDGMLAFMMIPIKELVSRQQRGQSIYVIVVDFMRDVEQRNITPLTFLKSFYDVGELIDSYISTAGIGNLDEDLPDALTFMILAASSQGAEEIADHLQLEVNQVIKVAGPEDTGWETDEPATADASIATIPLISTEEAVAPAEVDTPTVEPASSAAPEATASTQPPPAEIPVTPVEHNPTKNTAPPASAKVQPETSLRVNVKVLDTLMNLAGELVLSRNQLMQLINKENLRTAESVASRLDQVTSELQDAIMKTRMQPVATVFNKFPRVVRDLCGQLGKEADLHIEGKDVELDKAIIEAIGDPLTHLVRNACDHGVELPSTRITSGKPAKGTISLRAFHEAGKVNIAIEDDGGGIEAEKLKKKAIEKGIMDNDRAMVLSERDALALIFHPGLSTAEQVTDVSGRGVGMDVVRTNIESLGGTVEIDSTPGRGTSILIKLPLTLAIIPSLVVECGENKFAIPQVSIRELVRIKAKDVRERIGKVKQAEVLRLRGTLLPLVRLSSALSLESTFLDTITGELEPDERVNLADRRDGNEISLPKRIERREEDDRREDTPAGALNIIVVEAGQMQYGLVVDRLCESEEIVVKPLGRHMKDCSSLAGATILGDGSVALILDVGGIAQRANLRALDDAEQDLDHTTHESQSEMQSVLLFTNHAEEQFAVPMPVISRIERIHVDQIDTVGGRQILQYRGTSLPLLGLEDHITAKPRQERTQIHVVVSNVGQREVGLIAPHLVDIRRVPTNVDDSTFLEEGVYGSLIVDEVTTRLIDIWRIAQIANPAWFDERKPVHEVESTRKPRILLAEDSDFFRKQLVKFLEDEELEVVSCEDGLIAWQTLDKDADPFDLVVTDIEMPNLDGLGFAKQIRADSRFSHLPIVAVTSLAGEEDIERGNQAGVNDYQIKLDREKLIASIKRLLASVSSNVGG